MATPVVMLIDLSTGVEVVVALAFLGVAQVPKVVGVVLPTKFVSQIQPLEFVGRVKSP
ncbi:MAG TPA: hypothetical protein VFQ47_10075 [Nitrososphaera sp.]|nr:hypothetical protein [Nitrososphaera sp.]